MIYSEVWQNKVLVCTLSFPTVGEKMIENKKMMTFGGAYCEGSEKKQGPVTEGPCWVWNQCR